MLVLCFPVLYFALLSCAILYFTLLCFPLLSFIANPFDFSSYPVDLPPNPAGQPVSFSREYGKQAFSPLRKSLFKRRAPLFFGPRPHCKTAARPFGNKIFLKPGRSPPKWFSRPRILNSPRNGFRRRAVWYTYEKFHAAPYAVVPGYGYLNIADIKSAAAENRSSVFPCPHRFLKTLPVPAGTRPRLVRPVRLVSSAQFTPYKMISPL